MGFTLEGVRTLIQDDNKKYTVRFVYFFPSDLLINDYYRGDKNP